MKLKLPLIAAFVAVLGLTACGGGGGGSSSTPVTTVESPAALTKSDTVVGTGATAAAGNQITVNYSLWLYSSTATGFKGTPIESGSGVTFTLTSGGLIEGWVQGIPGMKVGGKRTLVIPASLGYGAAGYAPRIPANTGLVFDIELTAVK